MNEISDNHKSRFEQSRLAHEELACKGDVARESWKQAIKKLHTDYKKGYQPEHVITDFYKEVNNLQEYYHYEADTSDHKVPVDIYVKRKALSAMWSEVTMDSSVEQGGFYYGDFIYDSQQKRFAIAIKEVNPVYDPNPHHSGFIMFLNASRGTKDREDHYLKQGLSRLGFYHSHPKPYSVFFTPEDVDCFAKQAGQPYQVALVIATGKKQAGFFFWEEGEVKRTENSYFNFFIENEIKSPIPISPQISPSIMLDNKQTEKAVFSNFTQFTPDYLKSKGYDQSLKEYQLEFERLISQNTAFEPLRQYIPDMNEKGAQAIRKIKVHFANQGATVSSDQWRKIFTDEWIKPFLDAFINDSRFPVRGTDAQMTQLKKTTESAFETLFNIEMINDNQAPSTLGI